MTKDVKKATANMMCQIIRIIALANFAFFLANENVR